MLLPQISEIVKKYDQINFIHSKDQETLLQLLEYFSQKIKHPDHINDLISILEESFKKYSQFDSRILYNPIEFFDAFLEKDIHGSKIDSDETNEILKKFSYFEQYVNGTLKEKDYLEQKYDIRISLITDDIVSLDAGIFGEKLSKMNIILAVKRLKKLLQFYPISFIKNIHLNQIVIVSYFYKQDIYGKKIVLGGFETLSDNNIYLSFNAMISSFDHELYHQAMQYYNDFDEWLTLREGQNLVYEYKDLDLQSKGFARNYAKENVSEDQACTAEELILQPIDIKNRIQSDELLAKK